MVALVPVSVPAGSVETVTDPVTPRGEWLAAVLHRLAAKAHAERLVIIDDLSLAPIACRVTSSQPGETPYTVILSPGKFHGCDCPGFREFAYCKHYALCLEVAGWLPEPPDDPPPAAPISALPRADRRALAAADLAARYPSQHPARAEDTAVAA